MKFLTLIQKTEPNETTVVVNMDKVAYIFPRTYDTGYDTAGGRTLQNGSGLVMDSKEVIYVKETLGQIVTMLPLLDEMKGL